MPVAFAAQGSNATKSASVTKQIKKLKKRVAALEAKPDQVGQVPASLPPSGPAGGVLTGTYPNPSGLAANSVGSPQIISSSVGSTEVAFNSLGGVDIAENTLSGLEATDGFDGFCDPGSTTFTDCDAAPTVSLERTMNVLVIATSHFNTFNNAPAYGDCRLERNDVAASNDHRIGELVQTTAQSGPIIQGGMNLVDVQNLLPGTYTFEVSCNEVDDDVQYRDIRIAVIELSQE